MLQILVIAEETSFERLKFCEEVDVDHWCRQNGQTPQLDQTLGQHSLGVGDNHRHLC